MEKLSDGWQTPKWLFDKLNKQHKFDVDLCATCLNSKCILYCSDYLNNQLESRTDVNFTWDNAIKIGEIRTAFMNPPYSNPKPFIEKAWADSKFIKIVILVKADPSTKWWAIFWEYEHCPYCYWDVNNMHCNKCNGGQYNGPKPGCSTPYYFNKRIKFDPPIGYKGKVSSPSFPSVVLIFDRRQENV